MYFDFNKPYNAYESMGSYRNPEEEDYLDIGDKQVGVRGVQPTPRTAAPEDSYFDLSWLGSAPSTKNRQVLSISTPDDIVGDAVHAANRASGQRDTDNWGQDIDAWGQVAGSGAGPNRDQSPQEIDRNGKERTAYDIYQDTVTQQPREPKPSVWRRLAAGAVGGLGGYINSRGAVHVDASPITNTILKGDYDQRYAEWKDKVAATRAAAEAELGRNRDVNAERRLDQQGRIVDLTADKNAAAEEIARLKAANDAIKAGAAKTTAEAKANAPKAQADAKTQLINDTMDIYDKANPNATPEARTRYLEGITKAVQTQVRVSGQAAQVAIGQMTPEEAKKAREAEEARKSAESAAKIGNLNKRGDAAVIAANAAATRAANSGKGGAGDKAGGQIANKEINEKIKAIRSIEDQIKRAEEQSRNAKKDIDTYNRMKGKPMKPDEALQLQKSYERAAAQLDSLHGKDGGKTSTGHYNLLQSRKQVLYNELKDLESKYTGNPGWSQGMRPAAPAPAVTPPPPRPTANTLPPVTPPPGRVVQRPF